NLVSSAALRFQQQRSEIMINISQRVNYFFQRRDQLTASITSQSNELAANCSGARRVQPCFFFRTAFPLARKRRDSKQPIAFLQAFSQSKCMKGAARAAPFMATR
ncbi:hypothetical protein, partial [Burkholderia gladioli]|uniref:hypothetical protein n=1 Tax=Burkholderia gladioli TaxID=28095 RepID=UPI00164105B0